MSSINTMDIFNEVVGRHMGGQLIPVTRFGSTMQTFTPQWVVKDMIALLPDQVWNEHTTFLDISCKTGIFLVEIFKKLDEVLSKNPKYEDTATRRSHILNEQLYGLALDDKECLWYSSRNVYGRIGAKNMKYLHAGGYSYDQLVKNKKVEYMKALIQEEFGRNMFDVVVGNPPYNNDIYLDFVTLAKAIQTQNVCMITPAKWQAKGGPKNEAFRRDVFPFMDKIIYYPNAEDVFDITSIGGITIELLSKNVIPVKKVDLISEHENSIYDTEQINFYHERKTFYNSKIEAIVQKVQGDKLSEHMFCKTNTGGMMVIQQHLVDDKRHQNSFGGYVTTPLYVTEWGEVPQNKFILYTGDSSHCNSFKSYINTKFVRFLIALGLCASSINNKETWRFVPDPGAFDHIFTDQELYKKYNLTDEEINIIESVIKERK